VRLPRLVREYNRRMVADLRGNFVISLSCITSATARDDSPFWQWCKNIELPDFVCRSESSCSKGHGALGGEGVDELFSGAPAGNSVFEGMGISPSAYFRGRGEYGLRGNRRAALITAKAAIAGIGGSPCRLTKNSCKRSSGSHLIPPTSAGRQCDSGKSIDPPIVFSRGALPMMLRSSQPMPPRG